MWAVLAFAPLTAQAALPQGVVYMGVVSTASTPKTYFSINSQGRTLAELSVEFFNNELELNSIAVVDLIPLLQHNGESINEVLALDVPNVSAQSIFRITHRFADENQATVSPYSNGQNDIVYWGDIMQTQRASSSSGDRRPSYDRSQSGLNGGQLRIANQNYGKGVSIPSNLGSVSFQNLSTSDINNFVRFKADFGFQYPQDAGSIRTILAQDPGNTFISDVNVTQNIQRWDFAITNDAPASGRLGRNKQMTFWLIAGREVTLGAARFYGAPYQLNRQPQTVTLSNTGGAVPSSTHSITLSASAQAQGPVNYRIVSGQDLATIEGNQLNFKWNKAGTVEVEAYSLGDGSFEPATSARIAYTFDRKSWFEILPAAPNANGAMEQFASVNAKGRTLTELVMETVIERSLELIGEVNLLPNLSNPTCDEEVIVSGTPMVVNDGIYRLRYRFEGDEQTHYGYCFNGTNEIHYWSEVMGNTRASTSSPYENGAYVDQTANGETLRIGDQTYAKGLCIPSGANVVNTRPENLQGYTRFRTDVGFQYGSNGYDSGKTRFIVHSYRSVFDNQIDGSLRTFDYQIVANPENNNQLYTTRTLSFWTGNSGTTVVLGAPRFYREPNMRPNNQTISWPETPLLKFRQPTIIPLAATSSAGLPVRYRIAQGQGYARIVDGNKMEIYQIPDVRDQIVVEAWQPGDHITNAAPMVNYTFEIEHSLEVQPNERVVLNRDETIQEIIIHGNREAVGQVVADGALINARKITFKYTFVPGEWHHIVFPSDINLDNASNLPAKGYTLNNPNSARGAFFIQRFDTKTNAENSNQSPWIPLIDPELKGKTGYVMKLSDNIGKEPVEITFTINNENINLDREALPMMLSLDVSSMRPFSTQDLYIKALGAASNTLKVKVDFQPENPNELPVNHEWALERMRLTVSPDGTSLRMTLPNQDEARVVIMDNKGKKILKAVKYVAPHSIDISDLKHGQYRMAIRYGSATATRTFSK